MDTDFSPPDMEYVEGPAEEQDISPVAAVSEVLVIHKVWNISREHFTTSNARQHF
jgi:hypothetical protein